jgi:16S rRNA (cytosine1402-N4)-methyltransferase
MDLGVSSPQLDNADRGFSFNSDGPLDMRMDQTSGISAAQWLENADAVEIANVIYEFGEEKKSRHIASAIKRVQQDQTITTTLQLANIIAGVVRTKKNKHPATRSFQAIRIFINQELKQLAETLEQSIDVLAPEGRLSIISFHSIEDRIVKQFIQKHSKQKQLPKGLPVMNSDIQQTLFKDLGKQFASKTEVQNNKRSRSAILRVAQRTALKERAC